jgi:hypothetical protein
MMVLIILQNKKKQLNDFAVRTLNYFEFHLDLLFLSLFIYQHVSWLHGPA